MQVYQYANCFMLFGEECSSNSNPCNNHHDESVEDGCRKSRVCVSTIADCRKSTSCTWTIVAIILITARPSTCACHWDTIDCISVGYTG